MSTQASEFKAAEVANWWLLERPETIAPCDWNEYRGRIHVFNVFTDCSILVDIPGIEHEDKSYSEVVFSGDYCAVFSH